MFIERLPPHLQHFYRAGSLWQVNPSNSCIEICFKVPGSCSLVRTLICLNRAEILFQVFPSAMLHLLELDLERQKMSYQGKPKMQTMPPANPVPPKPQPVRPRLQPRLLGLCSQRRAELCSDRWFNRENFKRMWANIGGIDKAKNRKTKWHFMATGKPESVTINSSVWPKCEPLTQGSWDFQTKLCQVPRGKQSLPLWLGMEREKRGCLGLLVHQKKSMTKYNSLFMSQNTDSSLCPAL